MRCRLARSFARPARPRCTALRRLGLQLLPGTALAGLAAAPAMASDLFVGTTSQGTPVDFRLYTKTPRVGKFDFGRVTVSCPDGSKRMEPTTSVYHYKLDAKGRFAGSDFFTSGNAYELSGRMTGRRASGRLAIATRDDCFARVTWQARAKR